MADVATVPQLRAPALKTLIERFKARYGSFTNQRYLDDERTYKLKAAEQLRALLSEERLRELIDQGRFEEAKTAIKRAYGGRFQVNQAGLKASNNLMNQFDVRVILDTPAEPLARGLCDLLYGTEELDARFDAWVALLGKLKPRCWPAATYYLMMHDPQQHLFVKPEPFRALLEELESDLEWEVKPTARYYRQLQALGTALLDELKPLGAQDMIDVQSFIWVVQDDDSVPLPIGPAWPDNYDHPAFVIPWRDDRGTQQYGETYTYSSYTVGHRPQLNAAIEAFQRGGPPVYLLLYRPQPIYAFTGWARVASAPTQTPGERPDEMRWTVSIEHHDFPVPLDLNGNARFLQTEFTWMQAGLLNAFRGFSIRQISAADFQTLIVAARRLAHDEAAMLPQSLGAALRPYVQLAAHLDGQSYTPQQVVDRLGQIVPPIAADLKAAPDAVALVGDLMQLRLLEPLADGTYRRWPHLADATEAHMLRYAALTMLVQENDGSHRFPILDTPLDGQPHPVSAWPLGTALLGWYEEAGLVKRNADETWQALPDVLEPLAAQTPTAQAISTFLAHLRQVKASLQGLPPLEDEPLAPIDPALLDARIAEIQRELLIDATTIKRIYRSLIAGHHVILSGPPGTGKTHLARLLPQILWRDAQDTAVLELPADPTKPPTEPPVPRHLRRDGYTVEVVTATEDWGVRHVIGGIVPQLRRNGEERSLVYGISHGCLTRTVLSNYAGYDGEAIPAPDSLRRQDIPGAGTQVHRGRWLVIDEFTRAPIDAAFGSLLTTLGGQRSPLLVPADDGSEVAVPLPQDFRIIGTLNSFDRHFLNQISEAMKRRFTFIDILPPGRDLEDAEQELAVLNAAQRLVQQRIDGLIVDKDLGQIGWGNLFSLAARSSNGQDTGFTARVTPDDAANALDSFWRIFRAIRVYRQLGTAQAEAVYTEMLAGRAIGLSWSETLDAALADVLADQLQVLNRDEQRVLLALLSYSGEPSSFADQVKVILERLPDMRQLAHLAQLRAADPDPAAGAIDETSPAKLTAFQLDRLFTVSMPLMIDSSGLFAQRLRSFVNERGL